MSTVTTPNDSPVHVEPLHNPAHAAKVIMPQAPLGNATNGPLNQPGLGAKALLAKRFAKGSNPKYISPTDNLLTPCSKKISAAKKKHFTKPTKPLEQLSFKENTSLDDDEQSANEGPAAERNEPSEEVGMDLSDEESEKAPTQDTERNVMMDDDDENPF